MFNGTDLIITGFSTDWTPRRSGAFQSVEKVKQKCLAFSLICGIINMVMKGAENRKTRKTSDRICMYGRADTGRPSAQKNR